MTVRDHYKFCQLLRTCGIGCDQLSHNHCPDLKSFSVIAEPNIRLPLGAVPAKFANKLKVLTRK